MSAPNVFKLLRRQVRQHDAHQETDERGDAERLRAGAVDVGGDLAPRHLPGDRAARRRVEAIWPTRLTNAARGRGSRGPLPSAANGSRQSRAGASGRCSGTLEPAKSASCSGRSLRRATRCRPRRARAAAPRRGRAASRRRDPSGGSRRGMLGEPRARGPPAAPPARAGSRPRQLYAGRRASAVVTRRIGVPVWASVGLWHRQCGGQPQRAGVLPISRTLDSE